MEYRKCAGTYLRGNGKRRVCMKRAMIVAVFLTLCLALPTSLEARDKKSAPELTNMNHVFLGWVDLNPEAYFDLGYSKEEWEDVIRHENVKFQEYLSTQCSPNRTVAGAKDSKDEKTAGNVLYIKFSDVIFSTGYVLHLSVHFIDLKTNSEVASIPDQSYSAHLCGLVGCLESELDQVNRKLQKQLSCKAVVK
jgi:hypothetical protein